MCQWKSIWARVTVEISLQNPPFFGCKLDRGAKDFHLHFARAQSRAKNTCHNTTAAVSEGSGAPAADDSENGKKDRKDNIKRLERRGEGE